MANTRLDFASHVKRFLDKLQQENAVCAWRKTIEVLNPRSGSPNCRKKDSCDIFILSIPYGDQKLKWEVIFLQNYPESPPDFIFDDHQFMPDIQDIPSLYNWNPSEPESLLSVIRELLQVYRKDLVSRLVAYSRLHNEYTLLVQHTQIQEDNIDVTLNKKNISGAVRFQIKLSVDFSKIPSIFIKESMPTDCETTAFLIVTFENPEGEKATTQLLLSPVLERVLQGGYFSSGLPTFPFDGHLMNLVPNVEQFLTNKVEQLVHRVEKRKEYFFCLLTLFGRSVLEYDAEKQSKLSFLFEWNDFFFIIHITIPDEFPQEKPELQFQSIYSCIHGLPFRFNSSNYNYNPRWPGMQMAEKTRTAILECVSEFQKSSLKDM